MSIRHTLSLSRPARRVAVLLALLLAALALSTPAHPAFAQSPPGTPSAVTVTRADGTLTASGYAVSGATKYHITYSADGGGSWSLASSNHTGTSITFGADNAKSYIVGVRAGNDSGWSGWRNSSAINAVAQSSPPATPATVTVTRSSGTLSATGYAVTGATKYHITYSSDGGASWAVATLSRGDTSITISGVDDAKAYIVAVRAGNANGWSGWRNSASSVAIVDPSAVSAVYAVRGDKVLIGTWPSASNATKYWINYRSTDQQGWSTASNNHPWPFITISGLDNAKTYRLSVRAGNSKGWSGWTNSALFPPIIPVIDPLPDPIPQVTLTASGVTHSGATLTIGGEHTGAWWYQRMLPSGDSTCHSAGSSATATLSGLTSETYHQYDAYTKSGCSGADLVATARFTTTATPPPHSVSNLDETKSYDHDLGRVTSVGGNVSFFQRIAAGFTTGSNNDGYTLESVVVKIGNKTGSPTNFTAAIHAASGGNPASSATYTLTGTTNPNSQNTYSCSSACSLNKDTEYFLVLSVDDPSTGTHTYKVPHANSDNETNSPANAGWSIANTGKLNVGSGWSNISQGRTAQFKVTATPK